MSSLHMFSASKFSKHSILFHNVHDGDESAYFKLQKSFWILIGWDTKLPRIIWETILSLEPQLCLNPATERKTLY